MGLSPHGLEALGFVGSVPNKFEITDLTENCKKLTGLGVPVILDDAMLFDTLGITKKAGYAFSSPYIKSGVRPETKIVNEGHVRKKVPIKDSNGKPVLIADRSRKPLYKIHKIEKGINKKTGKKMYRYIQAPCEQLKYIQTQIVGQILSKIDLPPYITGFRKNKGIRDTAKVHAGKKTVISLDIRNFFNSIKQTHLMEVFCQFFHYPIRVSKVLSELCTYKAFVPQGAPSSPALSNIIGFYFFDKEIEQIAKKYDCEMTRFADDITFSTDKEYPKRTTKNQEGVEIIRSDLDDMIEEIDGILRKSGFKLNKYKTKVMRKPARQWVIGQVVNKEPNLRKSAYHLLRNIVYNVEMTSLATQAARKGDTEFQFLAWLKGKISHLMQVNRAKGEGLMDRLNLALKAQGYEEDISEVKIIK